VCCPAPAAAVRPRDSRLHHDDQTRTDRCCCQPLACHSGPPFGVTWPLPRRPRHRLLSGCSRWCARAQEHHCPKKPDRTRHRAPTQLLPASPTMRDLGCCPSRLDCTVPLPIGSGPAMSADKPLSDKAAAPTSLSFLQLPPCATA
jgi:hypothetical protein